MNWQFARQLFFFYAPTVHVDISLCQQPSPWGKSQSSRGAVLEGKTSLRVWHLICLSGHHFILSDSQTWHRVSLTCCVVFFLPPHPHPTAPSTSHRAQNKVRQNIFLRSAQYQWLCCKIPTEDQAGNGKIQWNALTLTVHAEISCNPIGHANYALRWCSHMLNFFLSFFFSFFSITGIKETIIWFRNMQSLPNNLFQLGGKKAGCIMLTSGTGS